MKLQIMLVFLPYLLPKEFIMIDILLVEDDGNLREVVQRSLEKERYIVEVAPDFRTGIQKIEDYTYDCILLDIMLPDGNGLELLEQLKEMRKRENVMIIYQNLFIWQNSMHVSRVLSDGISRMVKLP